MASDLIIPAYTDTELTVKKVEKGVTGIDYGEVTLSAGNRTLTFTHNLGKVPRIAILIPTSQPIGNANILLLYPISGKLLYGHYSNMWGFGFVPNNGNVQMTDTTVKFVCGGSMNYLCIAIA